MESPKKVEERAVEIRKLSDEELKKEILDLNDKQLYKVYEMAYYYIVKTSGELVKLIDSGNFYNNLNNQGDKDILANNYKSIIDSFTNYHIDMSGDQIEKERRKLLNIRKELYTLSETIYGYITEVIYIKELLDNYIIKLVGHEEYKRDFVEKEEISYLIQEIEQTLAESLIDKDMFIAMVSDILSIVPFRMSRSKYFDIIGATLKRNLQNYPISLAEGEIEDCKLIFDSSLIGNYGIIFDDFFTIIQRFKNMDFKEKSLDEYTSLSQEIKEFSKNINEIGAFIHHLGLLINRLIIIYSIKGKTGISFVDEDVFQNWSRHVEKPDAKSLKALQKYTSEKLDSLESKLLEEISYLQIINTEAVNRKDLIDDNLMEEMLFSSNILAYYNDMEFIKYERLFPKDEEIIDDDYLEQLIDSLIRYINRSISTMTNIERKLRMRKLLAFIELPFTDLEEFLRYIEYSLNERVASKEEILFAIDALNYLLGKLEEGQ